MSHLQHLDNHHRPHRTLRICDQAGPGLNCCSAFVPRPAVLKRSLCPTSSTKETCICRDSSRMFVALACMYLQILQTLANQAHILYRLVSSCTPAGRSLPPRKEWTNVNEWVSGQIPISSDCCNNCDSSSHCLIPCKTNQVYIIFFLDYAC